LSFAMVPSLSSGRMPVLQAALFIGLLMLIVHCAGFVARLAEIHSLSQAARPVLSGRIF
jgi:hypothetical protein